MVMVRVCMVMPLHSIPHRKFILLNSALWIYGARASLVGVHSYAPSTIIAPPGTNLHQRQGNPSALRLCRQIAPVASSLPSRMFSMRYVLCRSQERLLAEKSVEIGWQSPMH